jgi:hypothetical protein
MKSKIALHRLNRRTFLRLAAHMSLLAVGLPVKRIAAVGVEQATPQVGGYGAGPYGRGVYVGAAGFGLEPVDHAIYLPIVNKEEN